MSDWEHPDYPRDLEDQITKLEAEVEALREGYAEAISDIEDWAAYAPEYFQEKHDLDGCIAGHRAKLLESE